MTDAEYDALRRKKQSREQAGAVGTGKCRRCRRPNPEPLWNECPPCRAKTNAHQRAKRAARKAAGTCVNCDRPPLPGRVRCEAHHSAMLAACRKWWAAVGTHLQRSRR